jgi:hypothetical protein
MDPWWCEEPGCAKGVNDMREVMQVEVIALHVIRACLNMCESWYSTDD